MISNIEEEKWLSVGEVCDLLSVSPATLRRWSGSGELRTFTTPGGHRRFARSAVLGLLPPVPGQRPRLEQLGVTPGRVLRVCERELAQSPEEWTAAAREDGEQWRDLGVTMVERLLSGLDAPGAQMGNDAVAAAGQLGALAASCGASLDSVVALCLRMRRALIGELTDLARRHGLGTAATCEFGLSALRLTDDLLRRLIVGHQSVPVTAGM
ncbi:MAG: helix-turn-helix domain-containing protein [Candidatus Nanopelagicales bacterium]|nr:helix-turn-helix domain-containing protein [Candidatus Nanopelagicales bacterium]MDZ4250120.1 helix-turn-helix domain-containing protein [Candidatus Nanopelagicales bacterium]